MKFSFIFVNFETSVFVVYYRDWYYLHRQQLHFVEYGVFVQRESDIVHVSERDYCLDSNGAFQQLDLHSAHTVKLFCTCQVGRMGFVESANG
jgi:hypothetical protein